METQIERPPPSTTSVESLAAFLSDWSWSEDSVQAPIMAEAEAAHQTHPRRSLSPHPSAALPAPDLPSGTLRRRNKYIVVAARSDHDGTNDDGGLDSLATTQSTSSSAQLPLLVLHELRFINHHDAPLHQEMTSNVSPSCARTVLHKLPSARSGPGGSSGIPRLPIRARPTTLIDHRVLRHSA